MALDPEQTKVFDEYDRMFHTEGWRMFIDEVKQNQESLYHMILAPDSNQEVLWFCKGRNDVYKSILGLQNLIDQARKSSEEPDYE